MLVPSIGSWVMPSTDLIAMPTGHPVSGMPLSASGVSILAQRVDVSKGDQIASGDVIGRAGSTGRSTGPHIHYEVRRDGRTLLRDMRAKPMAQGGVEQVRRRMVRADRIAALHIDGQLHHIA